MFNPYAAGNKIYGFGSLNPTDGPVDKRGYRDRERKARIRRNALLRAMQAQQQGNYFSKEWLGK